MRYLLLVVTLCVSSWVAAEEPTEQPISSRVDVRVLIEAVMKDVAAGEVRAGVTRLQPHYLGEDEAFEAATIETEDALSAWDPQLGSSIGYKFVDSDGLGGFLLDYIYLQKFENNVLVWRFFFYRPGEHWVLSSWSVDDNLEPLFD